MPSGWLSITTHRLDIYNEELAKVQFTEHLENLFEANNAESAALDNLPTAYDYIRLGHPLSCFLEWSIAQLNNLKYENVISFSSQTIGILSILRTNLPANKKTTILYSDQLPEAFNSELVKKIYGYKFELKKVTEGEVQQRHSNPANESTIYVSQQENISELDFGQSNAGIDFFIHIQPVLGSILVVNGEKNESYISTIQHVRRRETIAMTPCNSLVALKMLTGEVTSAQKDLNRDKNTVLVLNSINEITGTSLSPLLGSSGLSIQYAIMMGLIHDAIENHPDKEIKFVVPPNCYGGTNDQARRVAACLPNVSIVDLPVDGDNDMVQSVNRIIDRIAAEDAIPYIIAEIPTNPRVEVPNLRDLKNALSKKRLTDSGSEAIDPVFILDQTFCPNVHFLGENEILSTVRTISYASGSKFPSGGKCTAGYCVGNDLTESLMNKIELHLQLCNNEATDLQMEYLAEQLPSMNQRIADAYKNTREFVNFIQKTLPAAKINFVSEDLASQDFTPSVFSLDLATKGNAEEEKEAYKRELNLKLINMMITEIPEESKFCVSYGQLKGCYWTIPATSTQGTTKEGDKDYIVRASLSANMDLERHKKVFSDFVASM